MGERVANCGHDENNRYSGGKAGDQTGTETGSRKMGSWAKKRLMPSNSFSGRAE